eukprot:2950965-Pyramimonas_sp.AAC.1
MMKKAKVEITGPTDSSTDTDARNDRLTPMLETWIRTKWTSDLGDGVQISADDDEDSYHRRVRDKQGRPDY